MLMLKCTDPYSASCLFLELSYVMLFESMSIISVPLNLGTLFIPVIGNVIEIQCMNRFLLDLVVVFIFVECLTFVEPYDVTRSLYIVLSLFPLYE